MKVLAIESSGLVAGAAIVTPEKVIGEYSTNFKKTHSQTLLPMVDALLKMTGTPIEDIDAAAVSGGPGSFTGLRIGSATAKGFALALGIPIVSVPTVDSIAYNLCGSPYLVCPLMDARRNQTYTGLYTFKGQDMTCLSPQKAVPVEDIIAEINAMGRETVFLGDGVPVFRDVIEEKVKVPHFYAPVHLGVQRPASLGALALRYLDQGRIVSGGDHMPVYLRPSQAERVRAQAKGQKA